MEKGVRIAISLLMMVVISPLTLYAHEKLVPCKDSIGECLVEADEVIQMDSEINRRILATTKFISYQALAQNTVPCSQRGASYYNCQPAAQANPYSRACTAITRCRT